MNTSNSRDEFKFSILTLFLAMAVNVVGLAIAFAFGFLTLIQVILWYICNSLVISIIYIVVVTFVTRNQGGSDEFQPHT